MNEERFTGRRRSRSRKWWWLALFILFCAAAAVGYEWRMSQLPNTERLNPEYAQQSGAIMIDGEWTGTRAIGDGEGMAVPLKIAELLAGDGLLYEEKSESIILTTNTKVMRLVTDELDATVNQEPMTLQFAPRKQDGELYLPLAPLIELFGVRAETSDGTGIVTLLQPDAAIPHAKVPEADEKGTPMREGPDKSFPIIEDLSPGADLRLWGEADEGWFRVQSASGKIGFVDKKKVVFGEVERIPSLPDEQKPFTGWKGAGKRINLVWEAVYTANPDTSKIGELTGVNVVSPTWFELVDGKGKIRSIADAGYSAWAHGRGMQVWGLFSNGFEPDRTQEALGSYETRTAMIMQLLAYARTFKLQGINVDFENVYTEDKENLLQFMREMTPLLHQRNLVVSIDVTPKSNSEMWSVFLDRARLAPLVDYMMVMAYDEHWGSSPVAGSVSSLSWAENSVRRILEEDKVPARKLVLGMPLYTRVWTEEDDGKGGTKVSSSAVGMDTAQGIIRERKLKPVLSEKTGQLYVEYKEEGKTKKIWIEDASSIQARAELAKEYDLAGVASWRRGFESADIWGALDTVLQSRP